MIPFNVPPCTGHELKYISEAIDALSSAYGRGVVRFGTQGDGRLRAAKEHQSPHYTTQWEDLPKVKG